MRTKLKNDYKMIVDELKELPKSGLKELLSYIYYIKTKPLFDPSQAYFWTKKWQAMEQETEKDKKLGRIIGTGKVKDLLRALRHAD